MTKKYRGDTTVLRSLLKHAEDPDAKAQLTAIENYEKAQALSIDFKHADCEEMIGEVRSYIAFCIGYCSNRFLF